MPSSSIMDFLHRRSGATRGGGLTTANWKVRAENETYLLVDSDCADIVFKRCQEWRAPLGVNIASDRGYKCLRVASASKVRMGAHRTYFSETCW
jgi:hypothetical protein